MKNLVLFVVVAGLWGCGPQQSSTERDQQQIRAEYLRIKGFYDPFKGTYVGTTLDIDHHPVETSLYLEPSDEADSDVGRLQQTAVPSLKGQVLECLKDSCFATNPLDNAYANQIVISKAVYDPSDATHMVLYSSGSNSSGSGSSCSAGTDCDSYIFDVYLKNNTLTGTVKNGSTPVGFLNLTRR